MKAQSKQVLLSTASGRSGGSYVQTETPTQRRPALEYHTWRLRACLATLSTRGSLSDWAHGCTRMRLCLMNIEMTRREAILGPSWMLSWCAGSEMSATLVPWMRPE